MIVQIAIGIGVLWLAAMLLAVSLCRSASVAPDRACPDDGRRRRAAPRRRLGAFGER